MGVINGQAVNATVTNAAFLNKNNADQMTFPLSLTANLSLSKRDESSAATINALTTSTALVRVTGTVTAINGAVAPTTYADGSLLIISNASASAITIGHESGSATAANRFALPGATDLSLAAGQAAQFYYDSTALRWRAASGSGAGGGGSASLAAWVTATAYTAGQTVLYGQNAYVCLTNNTSGATFEADFALGYWRIINRPVVSRNYMEVGSNFESNSVAGWQLMTVSLTSLIPTGAPTIGTAASLSVSATATNPISGTYSLALGNVASTNIAAGQGIISQAFTIDSLDQARVLTQRFAYKAAANLSTALMNFSGTSSNTWAVYIYDVTNSAWIQPAGVYNIVQSGGVGISSGTWQTPSNMTQFRLAIVCINATTGTTPAANAYQMLFDEFYCGQQNTAIGPPLTDWVSYTPTISGGFGTVTAVDVQWRRVGSDVQVRGSFTSGTTGGAAATISLPLGLVSTTDTNALTIIGTYGRGASVTSHGGFLLKQNASNLVGFSSFDVFSGATNNALVITTGINAAGNSEKISLEFSCPIQGWSSSLQMSSDTDTRPVAARIFKTAAQGPFTVETKLTGFTVDRDTTGMWDSTNNRFNILTPGDYQLFIQTNGVPATTATQVPAYRVNGGASNYIGCDTANTAASRSGGSGIIANLKAGDFVEIYHFTSASTTVQAGTGNTYVSLSRIAGPSVIAASESVSARYTVAAAVSSSTTQPINYATKIFDSHGSVTIGASWRFTSPLPSVYAVEVCGSIAAGTSAASIYKNGVVVNTLLDMDAVRNQAGFSLIYLLAGDFIDVRLLTAGTTGGNAASNYINIYAVK